MCNKKWKNFITPYRFQSFNANIVLYDFICLTFVTFFCKQIPLSYINSVLAGTAAAPKKMYVVSLKVLFLKQKKDISCNFKHIKKKQNSDILGKTSFRLL